MANTTTQTDSAVLELLTQIYECALIPESHKSKYVDYIKRNGLDVQMLTELEKLFTRELEGLEKDVQESKDIVAKLDQMVVEEDAKNDEMQAQILAATQQRFAQDEKLLQAEMTEAEKEAEGKLEGAEKQGDQQQIGDIRHKLGLK
ncbi:MAG: hypothetical protein Q8P95_03700 [bacterium]|nr:hypothetical protein [bacterium]